MDKAKAAGCLPVESAAAACEGVGAVVTMLPAGRHVEGVYPVSLAARLASLRDRANELPDTVKTGMLLGAYTDSYYQGYFYFKAQNLRRRLRARDARKARGQRQRADPRLVRTVERALHTLFATDRLRADSEWFRPSPALVAFIREAGGA